MATWCNVQRLKPNVRPAASFTVSNRSLPDSRNLYNIWPIRYNIYTNNNYISQQLVKLKPSSHLLLFLSEKLEHAEERLTQLEQCDCPRSCSVNGAVHADGSSWNSDCEVCSCHVSLQSHLHIFDNTAEIWIGIEWLTPHSSFFFPFSWLVFPRRLFGWGFISVDLIVTTTHVHGAF
jgi:hypothetical protein